MPWLPENWRLLSLASKCTDTVREIEYWFSQFSAIILSLAANSGKPMVFAELGQRRRKSLAHILIPLISKGILLTPAMGARSQRRVRGACSGHRPCLVPLANDTTKFANFRHLYLRLWDRASAQLEAKALSMNEKSEALIGALLILGLFCGLACAQTVFPDQVTIQSSSPPQAALTVDRLGLQPSAVDLFTNGGGDHSIFWRYTARSIFEELF
jgi:hypothetical protein